MSEAAEVPIEITHLTQKEVERRWENTKKGLDGWFQQQKTWWDNLRPVSKILIGGSVPAGVFVGLTLGPSSAVEMTAAMLVSGSGLDILKPKNVAPPPTPNP